MSYKWLYNRLVSILFKPSSTWDSIAKEKGEVDVLVAFFYPLLGLVGLVSFIVFFVTDYLNDASQPFILFKDAIIGCCITCIPLFISFFVSTYLLSKIGKSLFGIEVKQVDIYNLVAYSMTVLFIVYTVLAFPIDFKILLWLSQVYTIYLVWEGCGKLFDMDDNKRLVFTVITFLSIVLVAGIVYFIFNKFM